MTSQIFPCIKVRVVILAAGLEEMGMIGKEHRGDVFFA